jgi:hypothetical protein
MATSAVEQQRPAHRWTWFLVAVGPQLALVPLAMPQYREFAVVLAGFNITVCLLLGGWARRSPVFVCASICLALMGWICSGLTCIPGPRSQSVFSKEVKASLQQQWELSLNSPT